MRGAQVQAEARRLFANLPSTANNPPVAVPAFGSGWLSRFLKRNGLQKRTRKKQ
ncbi:hypothetical protein RI367_007703, partial [Sorochytrium milnesiophthora]